MLYIFCYFDFLKKNRSKVNSSKVTPQQMDSLRNKHDAKRRAKWFQKKDFKAHHSHVAQVQYAVSSTDGRTQGHICTHYCWQSKGLHRSCYRWKDLGIGRCGWQEPMTNIIVRLPCSLHDASQHCSQKMATREAKGRWVPKWQYPQQAVPT